LALASAAVVAQARPREYGRRALAVVIVAGLALVAVAVVARRTGVTVPTPSDRGLARRRRGCGRRGHAGCRRRPRRCLDSTGPRSAAAPSSPTAAMTAAIMLDRRCCPA
jgi:hypothetical protein